MSTTNNSRIYSIDFLRGIVMILMVLDHCRFFMHDFTGNPEDLSKTYPLLFFTRWITHFCAPVFIFLVGTSAYLYYQKNGLAKTRSYLLKRGLFLVLLELTIFRFAWDGHFHSSSISLLVIWAIGITMIFLSLFIGIRKISILFILGLVIVAGHNLLDGVRIDNNTLPGKVWIFLHQPGGFAVTPDLSIFVLYAVLPYFGIALLGWCLGRYFVPGNVTPGSRVLLIGGLIAIGLFVVLRYFNLYGDPATWTVQDRPVKTVLSFIRTTKYPTSFLFILMTLGPALLLLFFTGKMKGEGVVKPIIQIGQVPMFFYILHLFVIRLVAMSMGGVKQVYPLSIVYLVWVITCMLLYFLCRAYGRYKAGHRSQTWTTYI